MQPNHITITRDQLKNLHDDHIAQIHLNDGTQIYVTEEQQEQPEGEYCTCDDITHHHHERDGPGTFGQHYETEYMDPCPNEANIGEGVLKKRDNYVFYISKNVKEPNNIKKLKIQKLTGVYPTEDIPEEEEEDDDWEDEGKEQEQN